MKDHFNLLFVLPSGTERNQPNYYTSSKYFPVNAKFAYSHEAALNYLENVSNESFPSFIIIDESLKHGDNLKFIESYRSQFYLFKMDTLLFIGKQESARNTSGYQYPELISGELTFPMNKQVFMEKVFPLLTVYMV